MGVSIIMAKTVAALYDDLETSVQAVEQLVETGFEREQISLIAHSDDERLQGYVHDPDTPEDRSDGAGLGAVVGGLGGLLLGISAIAIPGVGPVITAGSIAMGLVGGGLGALAGGMIGAMVDAGIPDEEAELYAEGVRRGGAVVMVQAADDRAALAAMTLNRFGPADIKSRAQTWREQGWEGYSRGATVGDTVRQTEANIEEVEPGIEMGDEPWLKFEDEETFFKEHYNAHYASTGRAYENCRPTYRYGFELGQRRAHRGRSWEEVEANMRPYWEHSHPDGDWDGLRNAVRAGWERSCTR